MITESDRVEENSEKNEFLPYELVYAAMPSKTIEQVQRSDTRYNVYGFYEMLSPVLFSWPRTTVMAKELELERE